MSGVTGLVSLVLGRRRPSAAGSSDGTDTAAGPQSGVDVEGHDRTRPRWLDPAVAAARRPDLLPPAAADRGAAFVPARVPMVFVTPRDELGGLHHVRYDAVPLLDRPDDVLGRTMHELDGGDEVNVLERAEIWARVRTPNNMVGWVPGMTLVAVAADPAGDPLDPGGAIDPDDLPVVEEPIALEALLAAVAAKRLALREPPSQAVPASPRRRTRKPKAGAPPAEAPAADPPPADPPPTEAPPTSTRRRPRPPKAKPAEET